MASFAILLRRIMPATSRNRRFGIFLMGAPSSIPRRPIMLSQARTTESLEGHEGGEPEARGGPQDGGRIQGVLDRLGEPSDQEGVDDRRHPVKQDQEREKEDGDGEDPPRFASSSLDEAVEGGEGRDAEG